MKSVFILFVQVVVLATSICNTFQSSLHFQQQDENDKHLSEFNQLQFYKKKPTQQFEARGKRSSNDIFLEPDNDLDELLLTPVSPITVDLETLPPVIRYLVEQKLKEQRSRMTPRLGRDIDDDDCLRPRPPFAPRLGKKSVPFKPRLGRSQAYENTKC